MTLRINDVAPNFTAATTQGEINFHDWIGDGWAVLFSHPKHKTPVCSTELGEVEKLADEFKKRNVKTIGLSVDTVDETSSWLEDINDIAGAKPSFPIIADTNMEVSKIYNMLPTNEEGSSVQLTTVDVTSPDGSIRERPCFFITSKCCPLAITFTLIPIFSKFTAKRPPIDPPPKTQIFIVQALIF